MAVSDFFSQYAPFAQRVSRTTGIDPRIVLAQAALETGYGKSAPNFNLFGIKGKGATLQTKEFVNGSLIDLPQEFRTYESPEDSFLDYARLMSGKRYEGVRSGGTLEEQIAALQKSGYATDPDYGKKIMQIAKSINLEGLPMNGNTTQPVGAPLSMNQPQPQQRSGGLLSGILGNRGSISGGILGKLGMDEDQADRFRMAILAGTGDPSMAPLIEATQARMQERRATRNVNKTVDWLRKNVSEEVAQAVADNPGIASNVMSSVLAQKISPPSAQGKVVTADQLRALYPGQQIADGLYNLTEGPEGMRISKVGGAGSQTTIQMPGQAPAEDELRKKLMQRKGEDFGRYLDAGTAAAQAMTDLRVLQELAPLAPSGPVTGRLAEMFPGFAGSVTQLRQSIITRVAPTLRVEGSGATSDLEFNAMLNSLGSLVNTPEANQAIISVMMAKQQYNLDRANIIRQYESQNISLEEANNQLAALEGQSRIPAQVQVILDNYKTEDAPDTSAPKVRNYNPETGEFE